VLDTHSVDRIEILVWISWGWSNNGEGRSYLQSVFRNHLDYGFRKDAFLALLRVCQSSEEFTSLLNEVISIAEANIRVDLLAALLNSTFLPKPMFSLGLDYLARRDSVELSRVIQEHSYTYDQGKQAWLAERASTHPQPLDRLVALQFLSEVHPMALAPGIVASAQTCASSDADPETRMGALRIIAIKWKDYPGTLAFMEERIQNDPDPDIRAVAAALAADLRGQLPPSP
jgi:hypothetical protein